MAVVNGYATLAELKTYIGLTGSGQDTNLENAINGASRQIDAITGRFFYQTSSDVKYFSPDNALFLIVPDISTPSGLVVQLDDNDDGTHEKTITVDTDFYLKPLDAGNQIDGEEFSPITEIAILDTRSSERFDPTIVKHVKITAQWGFSAVPKAIHQACLIQALRLFKRKDAPFNILGNEQTGQIELFNKFDPDARELIKGYIKNRL